MFKFLHGVIWKVEFVHQRHNPPRTLVLGIGKERMIHGTTSCVISKQEDEVTKRFVSRDSWCIVGDRWDKSIGRKHALARTMESRSLVKVNDPLPEHPQFEYRSEPMFPRDFRRLVWACYWIMSNRLDRVRAGDLLESVAALVATGTKIPPLKVRQYTPAGIARALVAAKIANLKTPEIKEKNV